ncbi:MAG: hypothetical protein ACR9NN_15825 [Nostochopsis sp.]
MLKRQNVLLLRGWSKIGNKTLQTPMLACKGKNSRQQAKKPTSSTFGEQEKLEKLLAIDIKKG